MRLPTISFITTHFYDFEWTELLIRQLLTTTPGERIHEILIVDQDRETASRRRLQGLAARVRVLQYPKSERHFAWTRHDHAAVLNAAVREARGELICLFDSDAHPISPEWLARCEALLAAHDAILAQTEENAAHSHPCFMLLRQRHTALDLAFDEGLFEECADTGRLIARQLERAGERIFMAAPRRAFGGRWGSIMLDSIYHHGKGSFAGVADPLLRNQIHGDNRFFRERVIRDHAYSLSAAQHVCYHMRRLAYGVRHRIATAGAALGRGASRQRADPNDGSTVVA
jgi:hypothetical protein